MPFGNLEKLWGGIQPLPNLKSINLMHSYRLKEIPNLSNATNLETLQLSVCSSLVELPTSISNLHKLKKLNVSWCKKLRVIPTNINLASLEEVDMNYCSQLTSFPHISINIRTLRVGDTKIEDVPPSVAGCWSRFECLEIGSRSLKRLTHGPLSITSLDLGNSDKEDSRLCHKSPASSRSYRRKVPKTRDNSGSSPLARVPKCKQLLSLKRVCSSFHNPTKILTFCNCLKLDEEARRGIIQQSIDEYICLRGKKIPAEFTHKATGKSITIPLVPGTLSASSRFKACFPILPVKGYGCHDISCSLRSKVGDTVHSCNLARVSDLSTRSEHLFIFHVDLSRQQKSCPEVHWTMSEIIFEFSGLYNDDKIIECGVQIMTEEAEGSSSSELDNFETESSRNEVDNYEPESSSSEVDYYETGGNNNHHTDRDEDYEAEGFTFSQVENIKTSKHTGFRSWLRKLGLKEKKMNTTNQNSRGVS